MGLKWLNVSRVEHIIRRRIDFPVDLMELDQAMRDDLVALTGVKVSRGLQTKNAELSEFYEE